VAMLWPALPDLPLLSLNEVRGVFAVEVFHVLPDRPCGHKRTLAHQRVYSPRSVRAGASERGAAAGWTARARGRGRSAMPEQAFGCAFEVAFE